MFKKLLLSGILSLPFQLAWAEYFELAASYEGPNPFLRSAFYCSSVHQHYARAGIETERGQDHAAVELAQRGLKPVLDGSVDQNLMYQGYKKHMRAVLLTFKYSSSNENLINLLSQRNDINEKDCDRILGQIVSESKLLSEFLGQSKGFLAEGDRVEVVKALELLSEDPRFPKSSIGP